MMSIRRGLLLGVLIAGLAAPVAAQQSTTVTQADIQRLQDNVYLADRDLRRPAAATPLARRNSRPSSMICATKWCT
jgi:hypothetical protein